MAEASPPPDRSQDGLTWYGLRSFGAGEPRVILRKEPLPWLPVLLVLVTAGLGLGVYVFRRRIRPAPPSMPGEGVSSPPDPAAGLELEDRILALIGEKGGSLFQSEIVETLGIPKSTVSEAVNRLHAADRIEKVRKGRENLIRLK